MMPTLLGLAGVETYGKQRNRFCFVFVLAPRSSLPWWLQSFNHGWEVYPSFHPEQTLPKAV
jgi:hypothetical protein